MLSTCGEFNRVLGAISKRGVPQVYTVVCYAVATATEPAKFVRINIAGADTQTLVLDGKTIVLSQTSNITKIVRSVKKLLPQILSYEVVIEVGGKTYSEFRSGTIDNPEVVTSLFKQVVIKVCREN